MQKSIRFSDLPSYAANEESGEGGEGEEQPMMKVGGVGGKNVVTVPISA